MERKTISVKKGVHLNATLLQKIEQNKCNEIIMSDILNPLLDIIYQLKESQNYNYIPGTTTNSQEGWNYYGKKFQEIYKAINNNIFLSEYEYRAFYYIVQGIQSFTRQFSYADGLPDIFFEANNNLLYYTFAYSEEGKYCKGYIGDQKNAPDDEDYIVSNEYHKRNKKRSEELNLRFDTDDFFIEELAYTVRKMFIDIINDNEVEKQNN